MNIGDKYLLTTDCFFFAPDGEQYRAVFGTVHAVIDAKAALGIETNRNSTNWYVAIGDAVVAGCQIHYAVRTDSVSFEAPSIELNHEGKQFVDRAAMTRIYNADSSGKISFTGSQPEGRP